MHQLNVLDTNLSILDNVWAIVSSEWSTRYVINVIIFSDNNSPIVKPGAFKSSCRTFEMENIIVVVDGDKVKDTTKHRNNDLKLFFRRWQSRIQ